MNVPGDNVVTDVIPPGGGASQILVWIALNLIVRI